MQILHVKIKGSEEPFYVVTLLIATFNTENL
jgi:hypothetical protein